MDAQDILNLNTFTWQSSLGDAAGIPLTNRFYCEFNPPKDFGMTTKKLSLQVLRADCPNFSFDLITQDLNGFMRFAPKGRNDNDMTITFLDSCDLIVRRYFYEWMNFAAKINQDGSTRKYMQDICADGFVIAPLDREGKSKFADHFYYVMPTQVQDISYNYQQSAEFVQTIVTFKFMLHTMEPF